MPAAPSWYQGSRGRAGLEYNAAMLFLVIYGNHMTYLADCATSG
jgi:hypothetical protein